MTKFFYNVVDCEHEGDVYNTEQELFNLGAAHIISENYSYEDDEDPDADHEICGCEIVFDAPDACTEALVEYGCYKIKTYGE